VLVSAAGRQKKQGSKAVRRINGCLIYLAITCPSPIREEEGWDVEAVH
jgi:hypothetical protein